MSSSVSSDIIEQLQRRQKQEEDEEDDDEDDQDFVPIDHSDDHEKDDDGGNSDDDDDRKAHQAQELQDKGDLLWQQLMDSSSSPSASSSASSSSLSSLVQVNEEFDFAGEKVVVKRMVEQTAVNESNDAERRGTKRAAPQNATASKPLARVRNKSRLNDIVGALNRKKKMSTMAKSKFDWSTFKEQAGIEDELKHSAHTGYLDTQSFLQRTEQRQHEQYLSAKRRRRS
jgi:Bucentaur or craniofacial development